MADPVVPPWNQEVPLRGMASWRAWMTDHLRNHPDHHRRFPAGHDFTLVPTIDIARQHERLHDAYLRLQHEHDRAWRVLGKEKEEDMSKALDLKVTVSGDDPDATLAKMYKPYLRLTSRLNSLKVIKVERADGQPLGLEAEFEQRWAELHGEGGEADAADKEWARDFFFTGVKVGRDSK
jgi:hypothetical protein